MTDPASLPPHFSALAMVRGDVPHPPEPEAFAPREYTGPQLSTAALDFIAGRTPPTEAFQVGSVTMDPAPHVAPSPRSTHTGLTPAPQAHEATPAAPEVNGFTRVGGRLVRPDHGMHFAPEGS